MDKHELTTLTVDVDRACKKALMDVANKRNRSRYERGKWTLEMVLREAIWEYLTRIDQMEARLNPRK